MANENLSMIPVPIPTEIPSPPNLEKLPLDVLHSATVEMLIQQNEDLSSRLKVNIRRNSQLEQRIMELTSQARHQEQRFESLSAQNEIILEKEKIWSDQKEQKDRQMCSLQKEIDLLNLRYNELFATSQARHKEHQKQMIAKQSIIEKLNNKISILNRVRLKAKERLRHFLIETAENIYTTQTQVRTQESSQRHLEKQLNHFQKNTYEKENHFKQQLSELIHQIEVQRTKYEDTIEGHVFKNDLLESQALALKEEIQNINIKLLEEKKNRTKLNQLSKDYSEAQNEILKTKRELTNAFEKSEDARLMETEKSKDLDKQIKQLTKQFDENKEALRVCEDKLISFSKDNKDLSVQLESIQSLWIEAQNKLEKEVVKRESLERINRELSQTHKDVKIKKATERASTNATQDSKDLKSQLNDVYASQYTPLVSKAPQMDV